jgi:hypothetical protein
VGPRRAIAVYGGRRLANVPVDTELAA